jgi:hypothetical protein
VQLGFNPRPRFIGSGERAFSHETLFPDSFSISASRRSLVHVSGRTLDVGGGLQQFAIFQRGILGLTELSQYQRLRREL